MSDLFGYEAGISPPQTGYLDPEDPAWQRSVEHIQERQKKPSGLGTFGPQSGMTRGEPTRDEWQVTSYLDSLGVNYTHKKKLEDIDPTEPRKKIEYDIFLNDYYIAIETSPGWHEGGSSAGSFPQVLENDHYKRDFAQTHGIDLLTFDPAHGTEKFINTELVPRLRSVGVDAYEVTENKKEEAYGKTSPVSSCAICGYIMLPEEYDEHMKNHTPDQKERYGVKQDPVHGWNEPMGGAPAYQEADTCPVCNKPLVTYTDSYGEARCSRCNARLGYGKKEEEINYYRCEHCGQLIDPIEEYHTHEGKRYYGGGSGRSPFQYSEQRGSGLDQSQELPLFPTRGKVNTVTQTDEGFDKGLDVPNHLFHEEIGWYIDQTKTCPKCGYGALLVNEDVGKQKCSKCGYSQEQVQPCDSCETFRQAVELNPDSAMAEDMLRVHLASHGLKNEEDHFNSGFAQVGPAGDFFIHKSQTQQGKGQENPMQTDYGYQEQTTEPVGDSWKTKTKTIRCPNCGHDKELCEICNYHHHADNFMGEHEKFQTLVNVKSVDALPEDLKEFGAKYGTLFPCPMDIAPEDLGAHQEEYPTTDQRAEKGNPFAKSPMVYRHAG